MSSGRYIYLAMIYVGVDPAYRKGGFAVAVLEKKSMYFIKFDNVFFFYEWLKEKRAEQVSAFFCVENSDITNHTFFRLGARTPSALAKVSRNAGKNQAVSNLACLAIELVYGGDRLISLSPAQKGKKVSKAYFSELLKQEGISIASASRLTQDEVDAGMLCLKGKTLATLHKNK